MHEKAVRTVQTVIVDGALTLAGLAAAGLGVWFVWKENAGLAATGLGGGLVLLFAATIHRFESLKGLGMEAKTRELEKTIDKAGTAVAQLRALAELVGGNMLELTGASGRWGQTPAIMDSYDASRKLKSILLDIGSDQTKIRAALLPWAKWTHMDLCYVQYKDTNKILTSEVDRLNGLQAAGADSETTAKIRDNLTKIGDYRQQVLSGSSDWKLDDLPIRIHRLLQEAPVPESADRPGIEAAIAKAVDEARYVISELDFRDVGYWQAISDRRDVQP